MLQHLLFWSSLSLASRFAGPSATSADANDRQSKSCQHFILPGQVWSSHSLNSAVLDLVIGIVGKKLEECKVFSNFENA